MRSREEGFIRVVQIVNTLAVADGGPARNSFELNRALNLNANCRADLFWLCQDLEDSVLMEGGSLVQNLPSPGPRKISFRSSASNRSAGLLTLLTAIMRADALIIHGYYLPWVPLVSMFGKISGCRVFLMPHGSLTTRQQNYSSRKKCAFDVSFGWIVRKTLTSFVTGTEVERDELALKFPRTGIAVAGVGVPISMKKRPLTSVHTPVRLLSMSRIASKKRIDLTIDAVSKLRSMGIDASLWVAGSGSETLTQQLRDHAVSRGVADRVKFVGQLSGDEKTDAFCSSDIFLLPSEDENFGIGFAEAASFGVPTIVSTRVAAAAELPATAGVLIDEPNGEMIAIAVRGLMADESYFAAQTASREFAARQFSWTAAADRWLSIINA